MPEFRLEGFPAGSADVTVTQSTASASATATISAATTPLGGEAAYLQQPTQSWNGMSVTVGAIGNGWCAAPTTPGILRVATISQVSGRRIDLGIDDNSYTGAAWIGAQADVYRIADGEMALVRTSTVTDANVTGWNRLENASNAYTQAGGYSFRFGASALLRTIWLGVAAVDAGGQIGAVASVAYTPADMVDDGAPLNDNVVDLGAPYTEGGALAAPANLAATPDASGGRTVHMTWDPVPGAIGYIPLLSWGDVAGHPAFRYLELANDGGAPLQTGDMVVVRNRIMAPTVDMLSTRAGNAASVYRQIYTQIMDRGLFDGTAPGIDARFRDFAADKPSAGVAEIGDRYLEVALDGTVAAGDVAVTGQYWTSDPSQSFYHVLDPTKSYRLRLWAHADRAISLRVSTDIPGSPTEVIALSPGWQRIERTYVPTTYKTGVTGRCSVSIVADGAPATVRLAGLLIWQTTAEPGEWRPTHTTRLAPGLVVRDHALIKIGNNPYFLDDLTAPYGVGARIQSVHSHLAACAAAGVTPWVQVEWILTPAEWADLMAYLGAPVSSGHPQALRRAAHGQTEPWTEVFERILFEFGNEAWNALTAFLTPPSMSDSVSGASYNKGQTFGIICRLAALSMQASPWWSDRIEWVIGGWSRNAFGVDAASTFRLPVEVGIANYNGGWDETGEVVSEDDQSYQNVMASAATNGFTSMDDQVARLETLAAGSPDYTYGTTLRVTCYEAGPGYQLDGLNGASLTKAESIAQEVVMKSRAAALATIDTALGQAVRGFSRFNFFTLGDGDTWTAFAPDAQGGQTFGTWEYCRILQEQAGPSAAIAAMPIRDFGAVALDRNGNPILVDAIMAYALKSVSHPGRLLIVVGNRDRSRTIRPTMCTALRFAESLSVWRNVGDYREHNRYPVGTRLDATGAFIPDPLSVAFDFGPVTLPVPTDLSRLVIDDALGASPAGLLPGNFVILRFEGAA